MPRKFSNKHKLLPKEWDKKIIKKFGWGLEFYEYYQKRGFRDGR
jgi:hypothetical protein